MPLDARPELRPYQEQLVAALAREVPTGVAGRFFLHVATGGGKTRIANTWLARHVFPARRVLWVTKDWELLAQASRDLLGRYPELRNHAACYGTEGPKVLPELDEDPRAALVYSTVQTWFRRRETIGRIPFDVVVIDEVHWGEGKPAYDWVHRRYAKRGAIVGLTATPRAYSAFKRVGPAYDFATLAQQGYLARPILHCATATGVTWTPEVSGAHGDYTARSLRALADSDERNRTIVETYAANRLQWDRSIVFACDIPHAEELARRFVERGIPAEALHSQIPNRQMREQILERFRTGRVRVLVNVAMLTHGVDIPEVRTILLARPTASPTLFSQMVGRGSRLAEGKDAFHVVDFEDNLAAHGDVLVRAKDWFGQVAGASRASAPRSRGPRLKHHHFEPSPIQDVPLLPGDEPIAGLEINPAQTFGIEFELTREAFRPCERPRDWHEVAEQLRLALPSDVRASRVLAEDAAPDDSAWNVKWDASCGWEVSTRILRGVEGLREVVEVLEGLVPRIERLGLRVDWRTGTHVHLGWNANAASLGRLFEIAAYWEPALLSLLPPSRAGSNYCQRVRLHVQDLRSLRTWAAWERRFAPHHARYLAVNPSGLFGPKGTIEVRSHSGTLEAPKILTWASLWMRILEAARTRAPIFESLATFPLLEAGTPGDICELADFLGLGWPLASRLLQRRASVMQHAWTAYPDLVRAVVPRWRSS